jgi:hypothetical protein
MVGYWKHGRRQVCPIIGGAYSNGFRRSAGSEGLDLAYQGWREGGCMELSMAAERHCQIRFYSSRRKKPN